MASPLDGFLFKVFSQGVEVELGSGLNFVQGSVTYNTNTGRLDVRVIDAYADAVDYDNATSGLTATTMQDAIDEITTAGSDPGALTDSTGGTATSTLGSVSGSGADSQINNNFASIAQDLEAIRAALATARILT